MGGIGRRNLRRGEPNDMTPNNPAPDLNREVAIRRGYEFAVGYPEPLACHRKNGIVWDYQSNLIPNYTDSLDAIARDLLPALSEEQWERFDHALALDVKGIFRPCWCLRATPEQLVRAWLEATKETK